VFVLYCKFYLIQHIKYHNKLKCKHKKWSFVVFAKCSM
jgi:hypothetical protein